VVLSLRRWRFHIVGHVLRLRRRRQAGVDAGTATLASTTTDASTTGIYNHVDVDRNDDDHHYVGSNVDE
jgi:hypothetical protein